MKLVRKFIFLINILIALATLLAYLVPYINPSKLWLLPLFGIIFPYLIVANILFLLSWAYLKNKNFILSFVIISIGVFNITKYITFNKSYTGDRETSVKVMSYNLNQGGYMRKNKINPIDLENYLQNSGCDILLLQEINSLSLYEILKKLSSYPDKHFIVPKGAAVFSKYPIVSHGLIDFNLRTNSCLWADVKIKEDTIRFYSVHFKSNRISKKTEDLVKEFKKDKIIHSSDVKTILSRYKNNTVERASQVKKVIDNIKKSPYQTIVGGDFNDPPMSYTYQQFSNIFQDAFRKRGFGTGISYKGKIPFLRIDYIFASDSLDILDFKTLKGNYSDHDPIVSDIRIR